MDIKHLLEQYFEGLTTAEEEALIRRYFSDGDLPDELRAYKPLFAYFDGEIKKSPSTRKTRNKSFVLWISGIAASITLLAGSYLLASHPKKCPASGNYVIIDGRCYTDAATIHSATLKSLRDISEDESFAPDQNASTVQNIVENQLKEFDFLLDDN